MQRSDFSFFHRLRVRWAEVDMQKVVFNGNYLLYFDVGFTEYWRNSGLPTPQQQAEQGIELFLRRTTLDFMASARYDDELDIGVRCTRIGRSSLAFSAAVWREEELLVSAELLYVYADVEARKGVPVPMTWRARLAEIEWVMPEMEN